MDGTRVRICLRKPDQIGADGGAERLPAARVACTHHERLRRTGLIALCVLAAAANTLALADDAETRALRREVEELKQRVKSLEAQQAPAVAPQEQAPAAPPAAAAPSVSATEPQPSGTPASAAAAVPAAQAQNTPSAAAGVSPSAAPPPARPRAAGQAPPRDSVAALRLSWRQVARGMSQDRILDTLGKPSGETRINGKRVWYYYYPGIGGGSVFFNGDGRVSSNQAPNIGMW